MIQIKNFVEDLNYTKIIIHIDESVHLGELKSRLENHQLNHMSRWDEVIETRLFYVENCDLQTVTADELMELIGEGYGVLNLKVSKTSGYYLENRLAI